jgi:hypothetical protein
LACPWFFQVLPSTSSLVFATCSLPNSEAKCLRTSGVSELMAPKREVLDVIAGRCVTVDLSQLLAETSTTIILCT